MCCVNIFIERRETFREDETVQKYSRMLADSVEALRSYWTVVRDDL